MSENVSSAPESGLDVFLVEPERELWSGQADFVVARTTQGDIGILPNHEPIFALLAVGPVRIERQGEAPFLAAIDGGFLSVSPVDGGRTRVDILGDHVVLPDEVSVQHVDALKRDAAELAEEGKVLKSMERTQKADVLERIAD